MYCICLTSGGLAPVKRKAPFKLFSTYEEAEKVCKENDWYFIDDEGFEWNLQICVLM